MLSQFENSVPLKPVLGGVGSVAPLHFCTCTDSIKPSLFYFVSLMWCMHPKDLHSELILSSLQLMMCCVAAVKRLPVRHHSADYIFSCPLGSLGSF